MDALTVIASLAALITIVTASATLARRLWNRGPRITNVLAGDEVREGGQIEATVAGRGEVILLLLDQTAQFHVVGKFLATEKGLHTYLRMPPESSFGEKVHLIPAMLTNGSNDETVVRVGHCFRTPDDHIRLGRSIPVVLTKS